MTAEVSLPRVKTRAQGVSVAAGHAKNTLSTRTASVVAILLGALWTLPTFGPWSWPAA